MEEGGDTVKEIQYEKIEDFWGKKKKKKVDCFYDFFSYRINLKIEQTNKYLYFIHVWHEYCK